MTRAATLLGCSLLALFACVSPASADGIVKAGAAMDAEIQATI